MKKGFLLCMICTLILLRLDGQYKQFNVFPDLTGESLIVELRNWYKTSTVLDYSIARDTLFSKIDAVNDSLECVYTGMKLYVTPGQDPTEAVYLNGIANGINTEHSWPQGKGATGIAQSDMHHLYPSRIKTNSDRGNNPFGEINDNITKTWYYKTLESSTKPFSNIDLYSESINTLFEPREASKGNIARSLFYFYTMYQSQADAEDPTFFDQMKNDLCDWHFRDPVDEREWDRTHKIASYQGGKANPFVLDCSLVSRAYCNNIDQACESILLSATIVMDDLSIEPTIYPNPGSGYLTLQIGSLSDQTIKISISDICGRLLSQDQFVINELKTNIYLDLSYLKDGMYFISISDLDTNQLNRVLPYILNR